MKINKLFIILSALCSVGAAQARQPPNPPPSGEVVHLFGPGSVASQFLPSGNAAASPTGGAAGSAYVEPSAGEILHQMFVTGDPGQKPGQAISQGRTKNR
ncbi:hypothetical protein [Acidocella sp.]|uniref:hypothetical protein n=1 Tax=Acidocella sp. TaxID=50710 RepID=UPI0026056186|nr:hypothetical protein [Acidocella sp.]MDD2795046.1 hypothetical protein [Acidocella sp.]